jgi:hypothetical protein
VAYEVQGRWTIRRLRITVREDIGLFVYAVVADGRMGWWFEVLEGLFYRSFVVASDDVGCFDHAVVTRGSLLKAIHIRCPHVLEFNHPSSTKYYTCQMFSKSLELLGIPIIRTQV